MTGTWKRCKCVVEWVMLVSPDGCLLAGACMTGRATCLGRLAIFSSGARMPSVFRSLAKALCIHCRLTKVSLLVLLIMAPSLCRASFSASVASLVSPGPANENYGESHAYSRVS